MNEFYEELMGSYVYRWVRNHEGVKVCHHCTLWIDNDDLYGVIEFHDDNIVELSVKRSHDDETTFYLHFQMHDMNSSLQQFNTFFQYLMLPESKDNIIHIENPQVKRILLSCSGGLTTSYFAYSIQEIMNQKDLGVQVDAVGYTDIDHLADQYDMILLAPQIAYMLPEYKQKYGCKVMGIDALDFATSNFGGIIQKVFH